MLLRPHRVISPSFGRFSLTKSSLKLQRTPRLVSRMPLFGARGLQTGNLVQAERGGPSFRVVSGFQVGDSQFFQNPASSSSQCRVSREDRNLCGFVPKYPKSRSNGPRGSSQSVDRASHGVAVAMAMGAGQDNEGKDAGDVQAVDTNWPGTVNLRTTPSQSDVAEPSWDDLSMAFRIAYSIAMYGGLAFAGNVICGVTGVDLWGGFNLSPQVITTGFGYAVPPMMALLFLLEDEVVKTWAPARAIRDVEDAELLDFFSGMSIWQFPFVVAAGAIAEELFFRVAIQGGLTHALQMSDKGVTDSTIGLASLTGLIPLFVPFAQFFATALTAALTSSMYFVMTSPKDPKFVVAPVVRGRNNNLDIKQRVSAWYERRQQKKIYSPLMEGLLAMYLGFEWMHTGNILAPMITHTLYSLVIVGNGLRRIHDNREKLRQRVSKINSEARFFGDE